MIHHLQYDIPEVFRVNLPMLSGNHCSQLPIDIYLFIGIDIFHWGVRAPEWVWKTSPILVSSFLPPAKNCFPHYAIIRKVVSSQIVIEPAIWKVAQNMVQVGYYKPA